ncbi:protein AGENET DOMAIN (AGD)-CONTAINING P1-like [Bidens hawaiensis]|uniref:protein AGENET DOMAIN (AGD)-CONTAINING P1-like n=1 Tax=Bidens hawaiensis TaxID=980011 RepID=UPI00404B42FE
MKFKRADRIEVVDMSSGFFGLFYDVNIMSRVGRRLTSFNFVPCLMLEADHSGFLREFVTTDKISPNPTDVLVTDFVLGQKVDDFANDGWWVGRIASKIGETEYLVRFDSTNQDIIYPFANIRVHQDWDVANDVWVHTRN